MKKDIFELYQSGELIFRGDEKYLSKKTGLSLSTIKRYCRTNYLESTRNDTQTRIVKVSDSDA